MEEKRFYILVPETVQITSKVTHYDLLTGDSSDEEHIKSVKMSAGRLIAQAFHIGRKIENTRALMSAVGFLPYTEITAIDLSVRNTKELKKVSTEIKNTISDRQLNLIGRDGLYYEEFYDTNQDVYGTFEKVHTATVVGPISREILENAIGHLELYK